MSRRRLTREEQVEVVKDAMADLKVAKKALIDARANKSKKEDDADDRSAFADFWAKNKKAYGKAKDTEIEGVLWVHLKACGMDKPEKFENGITHFGLKKV